MAAATLHTPVVFVDAERNRGSYDSLTLVGHSGRRWPHTKTRRRVRRTELERYRLPVRKNPHKAQRADCRLLKLHATLYRLICVDGFLSVATRLQTTAAIHSAVEYPKELDYGAPRDDGPCCKTAG